MLRRTYIHQMVKTETLPATKDLSWIVRRFKTTSMVSDGAETKECKSGAHQMPQSVSSTSFWNLLIPFDLPLDHEFDLQLLRLAGTFVFTAKPEFTHSSLPVAKGGVRDGCKIEVGVSAPRFI